MNCLIIKTTYQEYICMYTCTHKYVCNDNKLKKKENS